MLRIQFLPDCLQDNTIKDLSLIAFHWSFTTGDRFFCRVFFFFLFSPSVAMKVSALSFFLQHIMPRCPLPPSLNWIFLFFFNLFSSQAHFSLLLFCFSPIMQSKRVRKVAGYEDSNSEVGQPICSKMSMKEELVVAYLQLHDSCSL